MQHAFGDPNPFIADATFNYPSWAVPSDKIAHGIHPREGEGFSHFNLSVFPSQQLRRCEIDGGDQRVNEHARHLMMASARRNVLQNDPVFMGNVNPNSSGINGCLYSNFTCGWQQQEISSPQAQFVAFNGAPPPQPQAKRKVRARRGEAEDSHSVAERLRRERISLAIKALKESLPNASNKTDKASMLDEIIKYIEHLQLENNALLSGLRCEAAVDPLTADTSPEGNVALTEQQLAKLMDEDMASAKKYFRGKGICLTPISLVADIASATRHRTVGEPPPPNICGLSSENISYGSFNNCNSKC